MADATVGVLDAYCPHLGGRLSDGHVRGNFLQCPFHGLEWLTDGTCANLSSLFSADQCHHRTVLSSDRTQRRDPCLDRYRGRAADLRAAGVRARPDRTQPRTGLGQLPHGRRIDGVLRRRARALLAPGDLHRLRFRTEPERSRIIRDDSLPHQLGVEVFLKHLDIPLAIKVIATFHGPAICSTQLAVKLGRAQDYTTLAARTYTGLIPVGVTEHVADNAVYVCQSAPRWHRAFAVVLAFWVHTVLHHDDTRVWDRPATIPVALTTSRSGRGTRSSYPLRTASTGNRGFPLPGTWNRHLVPFQIS